MSDSNSGNNKLHEMILDIEQLDLNTMIERAKKYGAAAILAGKETMANVFSSALSALSAVIDLEMEYLLCSSHSSYSTKKLIENPTALFITVPDENTTRHGLAAHMIKAIINKLIEEAETTNGVLSRNILCIMDEFGNMPLIKDFDVFATAARSRNIRIVPTIQSMSQLVKSYDKVSNVIKDAFQISIFGALSPSSVQDKEQVEKMAGHYTAISSSISESTSKGFATILPTSSNSSLSEQLIKKNLIENHEVSYLPKGEYLIFYQGSSPFISKMKMASDILKNKSIYFNEFGRLNLPNFNLQKRTVMTKDKLIKSIINSKPKQEFKDKLKNIEVNIFE